MNELLYYKLHKLDRVCRKHGVHVSDLHLLAYLARTGEPACMGVLAAMTNESTSSKTQQADKLEGNGLLSRARGIADRRKVYADITAKGLALLFEVQNVIERNQ